MNCLIMSSNEFPSIGLNKSGLTLKSELRHLNIKDRIQLASLLDVNQNWKLLAGCIPKPDGGVGNLINTSDMNILEDLIKQHISPTQALLDYWVRIKQFVTKYRAVCLILRELVVEKERQSKT